MNHFCHGIWHGQFEFFSLLDEIKLQDNSDDVDNLSIEDTLINDIEEKPNINRAVAKIGM